MKPLVENAADAKQVKRAEQKEIFNREQELADIASVASSVQGRRFIWRVLEKCRTFESVWANSALIHYNSGQQDLGHFLLSEVVETNQEILFQMMRENQKEKV